MKEKFKVAGFFAGVGGIEKGFEQAGFDAIWANELDPHAAETYKLNHSGVLRVGDITGVSPDEVPDSDLIVGGFPCQAFSVAGKRLGFEDDRGEVFFELSRIIAKKSPRAIFIENVKNLRTHDGGNTYAVIKNNLESLGYKIKAEVLNSAEYGNIPQNRERIYIVGFRNEADYNAFVWPEKQELTKSISHVVNLKDPVDPRYYYSKKNFSRFEEIENEVDDPNSVYQWRRQYLRKNQSKLFPTLTANMGTGGHNVPIVLSQQGIRKLTPRECFAVQGFDDIKLPEKMAASHLYKQAGNSVVVPVIKRIAINIRKALESN